MKKQTIKFSKYSGAGNDFLVVENFRNLLTTSRKKSLAVKMCNRNFGVGADGIFFVEKSIKSDYSWDFYNDDGSSAEMCLNASRCFMKFVFDKYKKKKMTFDTVIGPVLGEIKGKKVKVRIPSQISNAQEKSIRIQSKKIKGFYINTGVPHFVLQETIFSDAEKMNLNSAIRHAKEFGKAGANVTYFNPKPSKGATQARTFERGLEDYTLACGTGAAAVAAVLYKKKNKVESKIQMPGGIIEIKLFFNYYEAIGPAVHICDGLFYT